MIYISHRGNLDGVKPELENTPEYIDSALEQAFDVEIDLRMRDGVPHLGHDYAQYPVSLQWLLDRKEQLWIHVKEFKALAWLHQTPNSHEIFRFFCHEGDRYTLVSRGWIWSHDLTNPMMKNCVIPLLTKESVAAHTYNGFGAVCSDFIYDCQKKFA